MAENDLVPPIPSTKEVEQALRSIYSQIGLLCDALGLPKPPNWT